MNIDDLSTQLLYTTTRVSGRVSENSVTFGTAFYFSYNLGENKSIPFIVTNYHVVDSMEQVCIDVLVGNNGMPTDRVEHVFIDGDGVRANRLGSLDLVAMPIAPLFNFLESQGKHPFFRTISQDVIPSAKTVSDYSALEEVTFVGYPNGLADDDNKIPLIRRGITSTPIWNDYMGAPEFVVDAGVYPGSSGSPVFLLNQGSYVTPGTLNVGTRLHFVGIMSRTLLDRKKSSEAHYLNLGIAINSRVFLDELKLVVDKITS